MNIKKNELFFNFAHIRSDIVNYVKESRYGYSIDLDILDEFDGITVIEKRVKKGFYSRYYNSGLTNITCNELDNRIIEKHVKERIEKRTTHDIENMIDQLDIDKWQYLGKRGGNSTPKPSTPSEKENSDIPKFPDKLPEKEIPAKKVEIPEKKEISDLVEKIKMFDKTNVPLVLYGPSGTGKTETLIRYFESQNKEFFLFSVSEETRLSQLIGYPDANGNYVSTLFRKAIDDGLPIIIDEADTNPTILLALNSALSNNIINFPDKTVEVKNKFYFTMNTPGSGSQDGYVRQMLDISTKKRFAMIYVDYNTDIEKNLVDQYIARKLWKIRENINNQGIKNVLVTTRDFVYMQELLDAGFDFMQCVDMLIVQGASDAIKDKLLHNVA